MSGEIRGTAGGGENLFNFWAQRMVGRKGIEHEFGVSAYDHKQVIEIVRNASGQMADGIHFLGLLELRFESSFVGNVSTGRDVVGNLSGLVS